MIRVSLIISLLFILLFISSVGAAETDGTVYSTRVVPNGTFMLTFENNKYIRSRYLPPSTVVKAYNKININYYKLEDEEPIVEEHYKVLTSIGESGYILQSETVDSKNRPGKYIYPRTKIFIFYKPDVDQAEDILNGADAESVKLTSTYPKAKEQLKVIGLDSNQDFYIVTADFLGKGVKGYVYTKTITSGQAVVVNPQKVKFMTRGEPYYDKSTANIIKDVVGGERYEKLLTKNKISVKLSKDIMNRVLCDSEVSLEGDLGINLDAFWIKGKVSVDGRIILKPSKRLYSYEKTHYEYGADIMKIDIFKRILCDGDIKKYPEELVMNYNGYVIHVSRDGFKNFGSMLRGRGSIVSTAYYDKILKVRGYEDWLKVYVHLDSILRNDKSEMGMNEISYYAFLDVLINSLSYYPKSGERKSS